jgi:hypothetical protein
MDNQSQLPKKSKLKTFQDEIRNPEQKIYPVKEMAPFPVRTIFWILISSFGSAISFPSNEKAKNLALEKVVQ